METACGAEDGHTARPCKCKREGVREQRPGEDGARACMGGCLRARTTMHEVVSGYVSWKNIFADMQHASHRIKKADKQRAKAI
jgi:hypothetical protein